MGITTQSILFLTVEGRSSTRSVLKVQLRFYLLGPLGGRVPTREHAHAYARPREHAQTGLWIRADHFPIAQPRCARVRIEL